MNRRNVSVTLQVWGKLIRQALMRDLQFRSQVWIQIAASAGELATGILPVLILTSYFGSDPATSHASMLTVGVFAVTTGLMDCFVTPGLRRFDLALRQGELDLAIIRPVPTFFYAVMRWIQPAELIRCVTGVAILVVAIPGLHLRTHPYAVVSLVVWTLTGTIVYCTFWADLTFLAFWVRSIEPVNDLAAAWRGSGQYPRRFFPQTLQIALISFAPAALVGSYPAEQFMRPSHTLLLAPAALVTACAMSALIWRRGLVHYNSAST